MTALARLQQSVQFLRNHALGRGWSPLLMFAARLLPPLRRYRARLSDGDTLIIDLSNRMSFQYFYYGALPNEAVTATILRRLLPTGGAFVDVGANLGYYTRLGARLVGPSGFVVAMEPEPRNFELLRANVADLPQVRIYRAAAADRGGESTLYVHRSRDQSSLLPVPHTRRVQVPVTTIDVIMKGIPRCDLIKMDVEGGELAALKGAVDVVRRCAPMVYFEFAPETTAPFGTGVAEFITFFAQFPEHAYTLHRAHLPEAPLAPLDAETRCDYIVAVPRHLLEAIRFDHSSSGQLP